MSKPPPTCEHLPPALPMAAKLFYGLGEIPLTVTMVLFGLFMLFFYHSVMALPAALVGVGIAAGLAVDALVDPLIGYWSDRCGGRMGRRHPFLIAGAIGMGPCLFLLFSPPRGLGNALLFVWLVVNSILFRVVSAVYRIPYLSLGAELTTDYDERTQVIAIRSVWGLIGTLAAGSLSFLLFFPRGAGGADPKLNFDNYPRLGLAAGAVLSVTGLLAAFGTWRQRWSGVTGPASAPHAFFGAFSRSLRNRSYRLLWISFTLFFMAVVLHASVSVHFLTWYVKIHDSGIISLLQTAFYVGALAGVLLWMAASKLGEKRNLYIGGTLGTALLLCLATLLFGEGRLLGTGNPNPLLAGYFVGGAFASTVWVLPASMLADVVDEDEYQNGGRREGVYFGVLSFGEKMAAAGALLGSGVLLSHFVHLAPGSARQSPEAVERVGMIYGLVPGVLLLAAAAALWPYRLNRRAVNRIQTALAVRRGGDA
ncbi:MAG: MFS transporter [Bryobacteraceae bacterium]